MVNGTQSLGTSIRARTHSYHTHQTYFWERLLAQSVHTNPSLFQTQKGQQWIDLFEQAQVHVQWDPECNLKSAKLEHRSIQIGISHFLIQRFNDEAILAIDDITPLVRKMAQLRKDGEYKHAEKLLPKERIYPLSTALKKHLGID